MGEAPTVEEDNDRDNLGGAEGFLELLEAPRWLALWSPQVDPVEEASGPVHVVEGQHTVDGYRVGGDFPIEVLG